MKSRKKKGEKLSQNLAKTLLQFIQGRRYKPATYEELVKQLAVAPVHQERLKVILKELLEDKVLVLQNNKYTAPSGAVLATGTISVHPKGFGFVKHAAGPDVFIPKQRLNEAVDGDEVEIEIEPNVTAKGPEGTVIAILKRSRTSLAGTVVGKAGRNYKVFSPLLGQEKLILLKSGKGTVLEEGDRVICKIVSWPGEKGGESDFIEAALTRRLGSISDPSIDVEAAIAEFELPDGFSTEAIEEARAYGTKVSAKESKNRLDLTGIECVTIDPDTARDYDDAISLTKDSVGHYHLGVHIADVAHYVRPGSHLDAESFERCNSTYFPGECVPMLPEELSNELCSLKANVKRLAQSVLVQFDESGVMIRYEIRRTVIKSQKRFTYKEAMAVLEKKEKSPHSNLLELMVELCQLLKRKRFERGSIDFSMPDNVLIVGKDGVPLRIERVEYDITHQMIEEFMLKANEIAATHLQRQGKMLIYRVHEEPSAESFKDFYAFARTLGFQLPSNPTHRDIQKLFQEAKDSPLLSQLSIGFIRSMRLAAYSPENIGHYGLALEHYCHFTSPIRRYTDLIIQRLLCDELPPDADLDAIALKCSEKERVSFKAESSVKLLKKLRLAGTYFAEDPSRPYQATVTRIKPFALFFEVPFFDLEASLHISQIGNDYFEFNPRGMTLRGSRSGKSYAAGQTLFVRLDRIDYTLQQTEWSIIPPPPTRPAQKKERN
jgi:ribonuclease R